MVEIARHKLVQWGDPLSVQTKTECISTQEAQVFGKTISWCTGYASYQRIYQNELFLVLNGPPESLAELRAIAERCLPIAGAAGMTAFHATPGEFAAKATAAYVAAEAAFWSCATARVGGLDLLQQGHWPDWQRV